eukprot:gene11618-4860_t
MSDLEKQLSKVICENNIHQLKDMVIDGLNINILCRYPVGCQFLQLNEGEMDMSGYYLPFIESNSSGQYIGNLDADFGKEIEWTPLQLAAAYGRHTIIDFLISHNADTSIKDAAGNTAKKIAQIFAVNIKLDVSETSIEKLESQVENLEEENLEIVMKLDELFKKANLVGTTPKKKNVFNSKEGNCSNSMKETVIKDSSEDIKKKWENRSSLALDALKIGSPVSQVKNSEKQNGNHSTPLSKLQETPQEDGSPKIYLEDFDDELVGESPSPSNFIKTKSQPRLKLLKLSSNENNRTNSPVFTPRSPNFHANKKNLFKEETATYITIWDPPVYFMEMAHSNFFPMFVQNLIELILKLKMRQDQMKFKECIIAYELLDILYFWSHSNPLVRQLSKKDVKDLAQFLLDIEFLQHVTEPYKKIEKDFELYQITNEIFLRRLSNSDFFKKLKVNLRQFKIVHNFIKNYENVEKFYKTAFSHNGLNIKNRTFHLKTYKNVFVGNEAVEWIKIALDDLNLTTYGAVLIGEAFRHLKAFDHINNEQSFINDHFYYQKRDEEEFYAQCASIYHN